MLYQFWWLTLPLGGAVCEIKINSRKQRHLAAKSFTKIFRKLKNKLNRHQNQVIWTLGSKVMAILRFYRKCYLSYINNRKFFITFEPGVQMTWFRCLFNVFFNFLTLWVKYFCRQVALSSSCQKSQFFDYISWSWSAYSHNSRLCKVSKDC